MNTVSLPTIIVLAFVFVASGLTACSDDESHWRKGEFKKSSGIQWGTDGPEVPERRADEGDPATPNSTSNSQQQGEIR